MFAVCFDQILFLFCSAMQQCLVESQDSSQPGKKSAIDLALKTYHERKQREQKEFNDVARGRNSEDYFDREGVAGRVEAIYMQATSWRRQNKAIQNLRIILDDPKFEYAVSFIVVTACVSAVCPPNDCLLSPGAIQSLDQFFAAVFSLEILAKMMAFGLFKDRRGFFRVGWNWLDLIVTCIMWTGGAGTSSPELNGLYTLRVLRWIRVLRSIKMLPQVRTAYSGLYSSAEDLFYITLCITAVSFLFVTYAKQLAGGMLYMCNDSQAAGLFTCFGNYADSFQLGENWWHVVHPRAQGVDEPRPQF